MRKSMTTPGPWEIDEDSHRVDGIGTVHLYRVVDTDVRVVAEFFERKLQRDRLRR